jgi:hypothetical protein
LIRLGVACGGGTSSFCLVARRSVGRSTRAQRVDRVRRVGVLLGRASTDAEGQQQARALEQALSRLGWTDANLQIDIR